MIRREGKGGEGGGVGKKNKIGPQGEHTNLLLDESFAQISAFQANFSSSSRKTNKREIGPRNRKVYECAN